MSNVPEFPFEWLPSEPKQSTKEELQAMVNVTKREPWSNNRPSWNGWYCRRCHRFNSRISWDRLECRVCKQVVPIRLPDLSFEDLVAPTWLNLEESDGISGIKVHAGIVHTIERFVDRAIVHKFNLCDDNEVYLIIPTRKAIFESGGFKALFGQMWQAIQSGEIPLRRCTLDRQKNPGQLTRFFAKNYGRDYNTRMITDSTPFDNAPSIIQDILKKLEGTVTDTLGENPRFNELLAIGNYPRMGMNWHDDGESETGPVVASLSLGGPATMQFALKDKYTKGKTRRGYIYRAFPGCMEEGEKRQLLADRDSGSISVSQFEDDFKGLVDGLNAPKNPKVLLEFPLPGSGAIMIQKGRTLNKYYLHNVKSNGVARFVCTGRFLEDHATKDTPVPQSCLSATAAPQQTTETTSKQKRPDYHNLDGPSLKHQKESIS
ncbi:hypothetical protein F5B20DRAFT_593199 [Whalleya microplaca]|nr:hypothetical protein F5B20DRAFT_593199 [Whalleya microplaca]